MTEQERLEARLQNAEYTLLAVVSILHDLQPPSAQEALSQLMNDYIEANSRLGFDYPRSLIL